MSESRRRTLLAALCLAYVGFVSLAWPYTMDDAYISLRYADHLARGLGLGSWNPGETPVEGYSNFLWVLWMALATRLPGDPMSWTKSLGALLGLATILLLAKEGRELLGGGAFGLLPAGFLAFSPMFAFWSASGIEMPAYALALLAGWRGLRRSEPFLAGPALAAASLLRPEGLYMAAVAGVVFFAAAVRRKDRSAALSLMATAGIVVAGIAPYIAWRLWRFGDLLANTIHAKWEPLGGLRYFVGDFAYTQTVHLFLAPLGLVANRFGEGAPGARAGTPVRDEAQAPPGRRIRSRRPGPAASAGSSPEAAASWRHALLAGAMMVIAQAAMLANTRPAMGFYLRLFWPVVPFLYLLSGRAIRTLSSSFGPKWLSVAPAVLLMLFPVFRDLSPVRLPGAPAAAPVRKTAVAVGEILRTVHAPLAAWLRRTHPGATVALTDCGLLPYASDARIIDLWGLNDSEISRQGFDPDRLLARRPDVLVLASRDASTFKPRFPMDGLLQSHPLVARGYRLAGRFSWQNDLDGSGDYSLWVYERVESVNPREHESPGEGAGE